jgi:hypothetical protein
VHTPVISILFSAAYLLAYLVLSVVYHRRWDARLRRALGARIGSDVQWAYHRSQGDPLSTSSEGAGGFHGWAVGEDAGLSQHFFVRAAVIAVTVLGALPVVLYILIAVFAKLVHPLAAYPTIFLLLPIFGIYWSGRYRGGRGH